MSLRSPYRDSAALMAVLYALLAMAGQGLHGLTHGLEHAAEADHCGSCWCSHHAAVSQDDVSEDDDHSQTAFRAPGAEGHDPHNCGVCSLLAQLKVGHGPAPVLANTSAAPADCVVLASSTPVSTILSTLGARGPPAIG